MVAAALALNAMGREKSVAGKRRDLNLKSQEIVNVRI
jgi:hypothetical protein